MLQTFLYVYFFSTRIITKTISLCLRTREYNSLKRMFQLQLMFLSRSISFCSRDFLTFFFVSNLSVRGGFLVKFIQRIRKGGGFFYSGKKGFLFNANENLFLILQKKRKKILPSGFFIIDNETTERQHYC